MLLLLERGKNRAVSSLFSDAEVQFPAWQQTTYPIQVALVDRINNPTDSRLFEPVDASGYSVKVGVGSGYALPIAGVWTAGFGAQTSGTVTSGKRYRILSYEAGDDFANIGAASNATGEVFTASGTTPTTWTEGSSLIEITADLAFNNTAAALESALNDLASIAAAGGVTVALAATGLFTVTFNNAGARAELVGFDENLAPDSVIDAGTVVDGTTLLREIQTLRITQDPIGLTILGATIPAATGTAVEVSTGGGGANHKVRISLAPAPYGGSFTITHDNGVDAAEETGFLAFDASASVIQSALETLSTIGAGNVQVVREAAHQWLVQFVGDLADTDIGDLSIGDSGLLSIKGRSGILDLRTAGAELLLGSGTSAPVSLEIETTPSGGTPTRQLNRAGTLIGPVIPPASESVNSLDPEEPFALLTQVAIRRHTNGGLYNTAFGTTGLGAAAISFGGGEAGVGSFVLGGANNSATGINAFVGGGEDNHATGEVYSTVVAGEDNVASGGAATIVGGAHNVASGGSSFVGGGEMNEAAGIASWIAGGGNALASRFGEAAHAAGSFGGGAGARGDAQTAVLVARQATTNATPAELRLDGGNRRVELRDNVAAAVELTIVAREQGGDEHAMFHSRFLVEVTDSTPAIIGTPSIDSEKSAGASAWDVALSVVNGDHMEDPPEPDVLAITVTGEAATNIRWVARIELVEVKF